ncbi:MAG: phage holin family protein [Desulforhopalus sp.]
MNPNTDSHNKKDEKSIANLVSDLTKEITTLFRQEIDLLKSEMSEKIGQTQSGVVSLIIGGAVAYAGLLVLLLAAVLGLALFMEGWLAALLIAVVVLIVGFSMISKAKSNLKAQNLMPQKTVAQLKSDQDMARQHTSANKSTKQQHTA